jgi:hypothetical protein
MQGYEKAECLIASIAPAPADDGRRPHRPARETKPKPRYSMPEHQLPPIPEGQSVEDWIRSLTPEQRRRLKAGCRLLEANRQLSKDRKAVDELK